MDPFLLKRLWRRPWLSLCGLILSAVLCILVGYLSGYRQDQEARLQEVKEKFDILCVITNLQGTSSSDLKMEAKVPEFVLDTENGIGYYVRDVRLTKRFEYDAPTVTFKYYGLGTNLIGVNNPSCAQVLDPASGGYVTYLTEDFYESDEYICIVSEMTYEQLDASVLPLRVTDPVSFLTWHSPDFSQRLLEFQIVGYYTGGGAEIYIPYYAAQRLSVEISGKGGCDSISFLAADNEGLDELTEAASVMFNSVNPLVGNTASSSLALTIHDEQYRATVAALEQNITRTGYLLPVVLVLGLGVGFLISFLYTRNERKTYALMRTLGMTRGRLFSSILREQLILVAVAVLAALAVTREILPAAIYFTCYAVGCAACIIRAIRVPPTAILREQE